MDFFSVNRGAMTYINLSGGPSTLVMIAEAVVCLGLYLWFARSKEQQSAGAPLGIDTEISSATFTLPTSSTVDTILEFDPNPYAAPTPIVPTERAA